LKTVDATTASARGEKLIGEIAKPAVSRTSLTQRELSVLKLASDGRTTEEIAGVLSLGVETVRSHFKKAIAKLRARNRTHAVAEAMRQLLIV
jgi:DNA-binding CsgD family transcriptional regulator